MPRLVGATSATLIALWLAAVVVGALGFYALPGLGVGILRPSIIAAKPHPAPHRVASPHRTRLVRLAPVRVAAPLPAVATTRVAVRPAVLVLARPAHKVVHRGHAGTGRRRASKSHARSPHRRAHRVARHRHATIQV